MILEAAAVLALMCEACAERAGNPFGFPYAHKAAAGGQTAAPPYEPQTQSPQPAVQTPPRPLGPDDATPVIRPKLIHRHAPAYPVDALREEKQGWVTLKFQISPDGIPFNAIVHQSSDPVFDAPSLAAVVKCRYETAPQGSNLYGGRWFYVRYRFQFDDTPIAPGGQLPDTSG
jgi:TonB family protein